MADNTTLNAGSGGDSIRTDDISGIKWPCDKVAFGADGSATLVDTAGNGLPVQLRNTSGTEIGTAAAPVRVDPTGTTAQPASQSGTWNIGTVTTVSAVTAISNALPAGTNAIGKLAANSGVDIGDVDIVTVPTDPFGANADAAATAGSTGSMQAKFRLMTSQLDSIKTAVETLDNTVGGSELQVDVVGSLPAGTNAIGKLSANSGVDIGDVDVTSIATGTNAIGRVGHDTTGMGHGVKTVTAAGTDEAIAASTACKWVMIQAQTDNTGWIAVGASGVDATIATGNGVLLDAGDVVTIPIDNLNDVYIDSTVSGDGVRFAYGT